FVPWARTIASLPTATLEELCDNEKVVKELTELLRIYSASVGLSIGEQLGAIYLEPMPFRERNSSMYTALLKLKRQAAAKYYEEQLQKLYTKVGGLFVISSP
ncbi:hypothetical protein GGH92_006133, partial [Coemansia sp. RSA 2673]